MLELGLSLAICLEEAAALGGAVRIALKSLRKSFLFEGFDDCFVFFSFSAFFSASGMDMLRLGTGGGLFNPRNLASTSEIDFSSLALPLGAPFFS